MLPKIIVANNSNKSEICNFWDLDESSIISYEGSAAKVDDLRSWIFKATNTAERNKKLAIVIWEADDLSSDCQAILLKPLEELNNEIKMFLSVRNENKMLPTIVSRCLVEKISEKTEENFEYWDEVRKCWASGPAACIAFSDTLDKDEAKKMVSEVITKLKSSLESEISKKRLKMIEKGLETLAELEGTNINQKLAVDNFLIGSWRLIKT